MSEMSEKAQSAFTSASKKIKIDSTMDSLSGKVVGVSEKFKGTVNGFPERTDEFSDNIELFFEENQKRIIKEWELATKDDILNIEKRYTNVLKDMDEFNSNLNEYEESTNKKLKTIEERLDKLENHE
jgi:hypothetical protein